MSFLSPLLFIVGGLAAGSLLGRLLGPRLDVPGFEAVRKTLQFTALLALNPLAFLGALWNLPPVDARLILLPLVGLGTLAAAFGLGALAARRMGLDPERSLLMRTGTSFTNIGNLGGLSVFLLLGEPGYALVPVYKLFEELWIYGFLFAHSRRGAVRLKSGAAAAAESGWKALAPVLRDPFVLIAVGAMAAGLVLHASGLPRPDWYGPLNQFIVPASSVLLLLATGMGLKVSLHRVDLAPAAVLTAVKVLALPLVSLALTGLAGLWSEPTVWKTALVLSAMPMAFLSLVPPVLYGLNERFPTTAWALSMLSLVITLPALAWVTSAF